MRLLSRNTLSLLALAAALLTLLAAAVPSASAGAGCAGANLAPTPSTKKAVERATLCLLNGQRGRRALPRLRSSGALALAAVRHARDMGRRNYFSHDGPGGTSFVDRIRRTGYLRGAAHWTVGENLAWGTADRASAGSIVAAWMRSPGHRHNILARDFREIGLGIALDAPNPIHHPVEATYATEFGARD